MMRSNEWNQRLASLECWVCGATIPPGAPIGTVVAWVQEHEHSRIEREAARVIELARRKAEKRGRQRSD